MYKITEHVGEIAITYAAETIEGVIALRNADNESEADYTNPESSDVIYTEDIQMHVTTGVVGQDEPDL